MAAMTFDAESLKQQIPFYLTAAPEQKAFLKELKALSEGSVAGYFLSTLLVPPNDTMLQGDGWRGLQLFSFASGERSDVRGIVVSNSCDVSPENERALPSKITFAPIIKLAAIRLRFQQRGLDSEQIAAKVSAIKAQTVTNIFFLPAGGPLVEDYVALLDDLHSMPLATHLTTSTREKLFTLSMPGFYLFVFKLSVHFCRLQENADRRFLTT